MKKVLFLSLLLFFSVSLSFASVEDENKETVEIESSVAEKDRSIYSVECTIDRLMHTIHINYYGIGIPEVYIYDVNGEICSCQRGIFNSGKLILDLPNVEGIYQIFVHSSVYKGFGSFIVY